MKDIEYSVRVKYVDNEVWYNANDILYLLKDSHDNLRIINLAILEESLRTSTIGPYQEYLKK